jgi:hypothetical protein
MLDPRHPESKLSLSPLIPANEIFALDDEYHLLNHSVNPVNNMPDSAFFNDSAAKSLLVYLSSPFLRAFS